MILSLYKSLNNIIAIKKMLKKLPDLLLLKSTIKVNRATKYNKSKSADSDGHLSR